MDDKFLYNLVLRQLRRHTDDAEPLEYSEKGELEETPFFGEGELEQMQGDTEEDEVSCPWLSKYRIDGCFDRDTHYVVPAYAVNHLWALFEEKQA